MRTMSGPRRAVQVQLDLAVGQQVEPEQRGEAAAVLVGERGRPFWADVNVVLAGFRADHAHHQPARAFLEQVRAGTEAIGLSDYALASAVRLATNSRVFARPDPIADVLAYIDVLLEPPGELVRAGGTHWRRFTELCSSLNIRGNLVPDAYLAAVALEQAAELVTFDPGFARYPGLRWRRLTDE